MANQKIERVLIQTVGTGGPKNPVWEALAYAVRDRRPQVLVQWCSKLTLEETVPLFEEALGEADRPPDVRRSVCDDPDDVDRLARDYLRQIDSLRTEFPEAVLEVDFTSGTKPMSAAAVAAAVARRLPRLHYAVGPRDETGRVVLTDRLVSLDTGQMVADPLLCELGRLFDQGQYTAVQAQAERLAADLTDVTLHARAESLAYLAVVYDLWDRFSWKEAFSLLRDYQKREKASGCLGSAGWNLARLGAQVAHLKQCKDGRVRPQRLVDLLANSERRIQQGRYDDAAARLYRLTEYVAQVRFRKRFGIRKLENPTHNVPIDTLAKHAPRLAADLQARKPLKDGQTNLGLKRAIEALAEAGDPVGRSMKERYDSADPARRTGKGELGELLDARNQSLLAHGGVPVRKEVASALHEEVTAVLAEHLQAEGLNLAEVLEPARFLRCPWA